MQAGPLRLVLSEAPDDAVAAQRLRYDVFAAEPGFSDHIGDHTTGRDADEFDDHCEHLLAVHDEFGVVGCARLLPPPRAITAGGWYSATEFDLGELDGLGAEMVEMGRACVLPGHRDGSVTALMWAALLRYLEESGYRYLLGCVSVPLGGPAIDGFGRGVALRGARDLLRDRHQAPWQVFPHRRATVDGRSLDEIEPPAAGGRGVAVPAPVVLPPLMRAYLRLGAVVCGEPAVDEVFDVGDFVTVLDTRHANTRYLDRLRATIDRLAGDR
ncbi:GNAT family N-acetyltransferase [Gordonia sinesedis]